MICADQLGFEKHAHLKPFATKPWPFYRRMREFMPGAQPRGTHAFNPGSSSCTSASQALIEVNTEVDGDEDCLGPPVDMPAANIPEAFISAVSSLLPTASSPSQAAGTFLSNATSVTSPPSSSSISPMTHSGRGHPILATNPLPSATNKMSVDSPASLSVVSITQAGSDDGSSQRHELGKRKYDATGDKRPSSSKRQSKNKTDALNPVIISNALNSTLNRLADVMEKSLDATAPSAVEPHITHPPSTSSQPPSIPSQTSASTSATASSSEILDQALRIITADVDNGLFSEDEILAASMLFTSASEDVVRIGRTFIALSSRPMVQHRFILQQLEAAGFLQGKGKGKAISVDDDDVAM